MDSNISIIEAEHKGKAEALNKGLKKVKTEYTITIDSDTVLHPLAIRKIMNKLVNSNKKLQLLQGAYLLKIIKKVLLQNYKSGTIP